MSWVPIAKYSCSLICIEEKNNIIDYVVNVVVVVVFVQSIIKSNVSNSLLLSH